MSKPAKSPSIRVELAALILACGAPWAACAGPADDADTMMTPVGSETGAGPSVTGPPPTAPGTTPGVVPPAVPTPPAMPTPTPPAVTPPAATPPMPTEPAPEPTPEPTMDGPPVRSTTGPSYAATVAAIFQMKCTASCHEQGGLLGGVGGIDLVQLDLTTASGYAQLTTPRSVQVPTMWLVGAGLDDSYLWHKLQNTHMSVGGTGVKMPLTGELTAEEITAVQAWIEGGATP